MSEIQENTSKEAKKVEAQFENAMNKALALLKGNKFIPVSSIPNDEIDAIMDEFFKEEIESKKEEFKTKLKELLKKKVDFDNFVKQKQQEFNKVILDKKKEFTKELNEVTGLVDGIEKLKQDYLNVLTTPVNAAEEVSAENNDTVE